jgi:hypothetical protein
MDRLPDLVDITTCIRLSLIKKSELRHAIAKNNAVDFKITNGLEAVHVLLPVFDDLIKNLYDCHYSQFLVALVTLDRIHLLPSRLLSPHARYYVREIARELLVPSGSAFSSSINN